MSELTDPRGITVEGLKELGLLCRCGCQDSSINSTYDNLPEWVKAIIDYGATLSTPATTILDILAAIKLSLPPGLTLAMWITNIAIQYDGFMSQEMFLFFNSFDGPYSFIYNPESGELVYYDPTADDPYKMPLEAEKWLLSVNEMAAGFPRAMEACHCEAKNDEPCPEAPLPLPLPISIASPIILDLDGDGVETIATQHGSNFDHDGNRFAEKSGWAGADDALLVFDRNGNGQIDSGNELFGNNYTLANGKKAANGFEALKEFDSNGDGVVDKNDERWSELQLWQDKNGDGKVNDGELLTLEEAGVAGLNTRYTNQSKTDENGNKHLQAGSFIREDGTTGQMTDVWFQVDLADTVYLDEIAINCPSILGLPNLRRYRNIPSIHQAMTVTPEGIRHQYAPLPNELGEPDTLGDIEILCATKDLGLSGADEVCGDRRT